MDEDLDEKYRPLQRLPGLYRRWEFADVIESGKDYRVKDAGMARDGTALFSIYVGAPRGACDDPPIWACDD